MVISLHKRNILNYLAHFYLAQGDDGLIVGNLLADYVRGNKYLDFPESIQRGIRLHRLIDEFTDTHPEVDKTKIRLREKYRKYSPVISDVFYDYALGNNWKDYSDIPLKVFTKDIYKTLYKYTNVMTDKANLTLGYMSERDWLFHYSTYFGIEKALEGLSRRARFDTNMFEAIEDLKRDEKKIEAEFRTFFEDLRSFVKDFKE